MFPECFPVGRIQRVDVDFIPGKRNGSVFSVSDKVNGRILSVSVGIEIGIDLIQRGRIAVQIQDFVIVPEVVHNGFGIVHGGIDHHQHFFIGRRRQSVAGIQRTLRKGDLIFRTVLFRRIGEIGNIILRAVGIFRTVFRCQHHICRRIIAVAVFALCGCILCISVRIAAAVIG